MPLYPGALERLELDLDKRIGAAAAKAAEVTKAHLDEPGMGRKYPHLPHRSSAPGQYPARQFGPLQDSVGSERVASTVYHVGSIYNTPPEAYYMEFNSLKHGGRPWLSKSMRDPETHARMNRAVMMGTAGSD